MFNKFQSTTNKWIVYGFLNKENRQLWKVNGLENLLEQNGDICKTEQMLRISAIHKIFTITIFALKVIFFIFVNYCINKRR